MVDHPDWTRPCSDCEAVHEAGGRRTLRVTLTGSLREPPCAECPKVPAGAPKCPSSGKDLDAPAWLDVLRWYLRGKAVGFGPDVPDDLADLAAVIAGFLDTRERQEQALRAARKHVPRPAAAVLNWVAFG